MFYHTVGVLSCIVEKGMYCMSDLALLYLNENSYWKDLLFLKICIYVGFWTGIDQSGS